MCFTAAHLRSRSLNIVSLSDMIEGSYRSWDLYTTGQLVDGLQQKKENRFSLNGNGLMSSFLGRQFYRSPLYLSTAYKDAKSLSHDLSEEDSQHYLAKHIPKPKFWLWLFFPAFTPSWCNHSFVGPVILSAWKITATWRNCSTANCLMASASKESRKSASKTHWRSPWNHSVSPLFAWNIWCRIETSGVKLSNVEQKFVKPEEIQRLNCTGNLEKALPHQPLLPPFFVLTAQDSFAYRLVSLAICVFTDPVLNRKVD